MAAGGRRPVFYPLRGPRLPHIERAGSGQGIGYAFLPMPAPQDIDLRRPAVWGLTSKGPAANLGEIGGRCEEESALYVEHGSYAMPEFTMQGPAPRYNAKRLHYHPENNLTLACPVLFHIVKIVR